MHDGDWSNWFGGPVTIGNYSCLGSQVNFLCGPWVDHVTALNHRAVIHYPLWETPGREIFIGHGVWIGWYVTILHGVTIGNGAVVGTGSVIVRDVPPYAVVAGNPAAIKRLRFDPETCAAIEATRWWEWTEEEVKARASDFLDVGTFLAKWGGNNGRA